MEIDDFIQQQKDKISSLSQNMDLELRLNDPDSTTKKYDDDHDDDHDHDVAMVQTESCTGNTQTTRLENIPSHTITSSLQKATNDNIQQVIKDEDQTSHPNLLTNKNNHSPLPHTPPLARPTRIHTKYEILKPRITTMMNPKLLMTPTPR
jgi:hypothetical protein